MVTGSIISLLQIRKIRLRNVINLVRFPQLVNIKGRFSIGSVGSVIPTLLLYLVYEWGIEVIDTDFYFGELTRT